MNRDKVCDRQGCLNPSVEKHTLPDGCRVDVCDEHEILPVGTETSSGGFTHEGNLPGVYWHEHYLGDDLTDAEWDTAMRNYFTEIGVMAEATPDGDYA